MAETKVRQSNIELLRIVAIFLVMVGHINGFMAEGRIPPMTADADSVVIIRNVIGSLASVCVALFMLISGWFSIKPNLKSVVTLWTQIFFVYIYCFSIQVVLGGANLKTLATCFLPFTMGNWFVRCYLILMLLSPALNLLSERLTQRGYILFLSAFTAIALMWGCISPTDAAGFNQGMSSLSLVYVYMVGRFMRLHLQINRSKWFWLWGYLLLSLVIFLGRVAHLPWILYYCNPILVLSAALLFMFFVRLDIGHCGFINWVASSVFAAFILHTRAPVFGWLQTFNLEKLHALPYLQYLCMILVVLIVIFMIAILMDKIRAYIFKPLINFVSRIFFLSDNSEKLISLKKE